MNIEKIKMFEQYGGDSNEILNELVDDITEQLIDRISCNLRKEFKKMSWEEILKYIEQINVSTNYAENKIDELRNELLTNEIESIKHSASYYPENQEYYDNKINQIIQDLS